MARANQTRAYITPIDVADGSLPPQKGRGFYTLTAAHTYVFVLGGPDCSRVSGHLRWSAAFAGNARVEDSNVPPGEVTDIELGATTGGWVDEDPSTAFVGTVGAGATVVNGVVTVAAGSAGGAMFHVADTGAARHRLLVACTTGGEISVCAHSKE